MVHVLGIHTCRDQHRERLQEHFVLDLPEVYKSYLDLTDERRVFEFEAHREFEMLCSSLLLHEHFVLIDTLVSSPIDSLVRAHRVFSRGRLQDHILAELSDRDLVTRLLTCSTILEKIVLA